MYNRYQGNTGRFVRLPEPFEGGGQRAERRRMPGQTLSGGHSRRAEGRSAPPAGGPGTPGRAASAEGGRAHARAAGTGRPFGEAAGRFRRRALGQAFKPEHRRICSSSAVVYLMYRENGDKQLLVVLAALLLLSPLLGSRAGRICSSPAC